MEWKKAVNYTIVFLFFVNAVLFGLNLYKKSDVTVGGNGLVVWFFFFEKNYSIINSLFPLHFNTYLVLVIYSSPSMSIIQFKSTVFPFAK